MTGQQQMPTFNLRRYGERSCDTAVVNARRVASGLALSCVATPLNACGGARAIDAGDATVLVSERTRGGMDALLEGTLAVVDGCLGITDADYRDIVVVWPHGTEVTSDDPSTIDLPDVGEIAVGESVSIGGGVYRTDDDHPGGITPPPYCDAGEIWLAR